ncbi:MAG: nucleoside triphosphate pyrophosphohydrolase [Rhodospirillales bacterium]|jgi:MazG family protein|nr:nucleoside triphosphate pyrophosphohydrolase [Rhodospirillales bacterium]HIJ42672.1 nucleoside triphosphate pyrophosphohydrolase [Rhodospirillaceae bacterium]HIJ91799.1 nucleoside triphosphate pyrophosphohydrolase [Rhodospirillaceae bacterium]HJP54505.1 nucleoside triphosphate pyrophosphohydrolase [Rhodospirillales bacterium]
MSAKMDKLMETMALLRDPERGCPWDVEQTFESIAPHTIEEAYEVADAVESGDMTALKNELGDLLLQVVFHAQMAKEAGYFDFDGVVEAIRDKLVRRHPHVYGDAVVAGAAAQTRAWEDYKAAERQDGAGKNDDDDDDTGGVLAGVARALPALSRALKLQKRAARVGFDWDQAAAVLTKIAEESAELEDVMATGSDPARLQEEIGDLLFTCVNLSRKLGIDPELALRQGNGKFECRFRRLEVRLAAAGKSPAEASARELEAFWEQAKEDERRQG